MRASILVLTVCGAGCTGGSSETEREAGQLGVVDSGVIDSGGADAHFAPALEQCETELVPATGGAPRIDIEVRGQTVGIIGEASVGPATCTTEVTATSLSLICPGEEGMSFDLSEPLPGGVLQYPGAITPLWVGFAVRDCELWRSQCSITRGARMDLTVGGDMATINETGTIELGDYLMELYGAGEFTGDGTNGCAAGPNLSVQYLVTKM